MSQQVHSGTRTVPTAGTAVRLRPTSTEARWCIIQALSTNTGVIYVRGRGEDGGIALTAYSAVTLPAMGDNPHVDLREVDINATVSGEGVAFLWYSGD